MNDMTVARVIESAEKTRIARKILEALPDWFGVEESREAYIRQSADQPFFAAYQHEQPIVFSCY